MSAFAMPRVPADPLLSLIGAFRDDPRENKIDLSVGVFRNERGHTPVMAAVKEAEAILCESQLSKSYLGPEGNGAFIEYVAKLAFGPTAKTHGPDAAFAGLQTPGGTGALRLAADLLAANPGTDRIWVGLPTWGNHAPVLAATGLEVRTYRAIDEDAQTFDIEAMLSALREARAGDAVLLQACCHNPTGIDPTPAQWETIIAAIAARGLIPLVDMAYQGLGQGLDTDAAALRRIVAEIPDVLVAISCNKNFGLYRERAGALFISIRNAAMRASVASNASALVRANYSMPPDHGAAIVATILGDATLSAIWRNELDAMRMRLRTIREALGSADASSPIPLAPIVRQNGMFSRLPLKAGTITALREREAIYMAPDGRINLAGLALADVDRFAAALASLAEQVAS